MWVTDPTTNVNEVQEQLDTLQQVVGTDAGGVAHELYTGTSGLSVLLPDDTPAAEVLGSSWGDQAGEVRAHNGLEVTGPLRASELTQDRVLVSGADGLVQSFPITAAEISTLAGNSTLVTQLEADLDTRALKAETVYRNRFTTSSANTWKKICTVTNLVQNGFTVVIRVTMPSGYNAQNSQVRYSTLRFNTSDGVSVQAGAAGGYFNGAARAEGDHEFAVVQNAPIFTIPTSFSFYVKTIGLSGTGCVIETVTPGTFSFHGVAEDPSGTYLLPTAEKRGTQPWVEVSIGWSGNILRSTGQVTPTIDATTQGVKVLTFPAHAAGNSYVAQVSSGGHIVKMDDSRTSTSLTVRTYNPDGSPEDWWICVTSAA